jgi:hypothetical protein
LTVKATDCGNALVITGSNNTVFCNIDGNVAVAGTGNKLVGRINGTLTVSGSGHDLKGLSAGDISGMVSAATTDANGQVVVLHGLSGTPSFVQFEKIPNSHNTLEVGSRSATTFTVIVRDESLATVKNTMVAFRWRANL